MGGLVAKSKDFLGKRSLTRSDTAKAGRKQLVGLLADDPSFVIPEGSQIVAGPFQGDTAPMLGHVTSSYYSPILKRSIAMAVVKGGLDKIGETVTIPLASGRQIAARVTSSVFYDSEGARQHVE
jgi:sarcosine oxidase subunit alpha